MTKITHIQAREILDSRGNPTIEVDVQLAGGALGRGLRREDAETVPDVVVLRIQRRRRCATEIDYHRGNSNHRRDSGQCPNGPVRR